MSIVNYMTHDRKEAELLRLFTGLNLVGQAHLPPKRHIFHLSIYRFTDRMEAIDSQIEWRLHSEALHQAAPGRDGTLPCLPVITTGRR